MNAGKKKWVWRLVPVLIVISLSWNPVIAGEQTLKTHTPNETSFPVAQNAGENQDADLDDFFQDDSTVSDGPVDDLDEFEDNGEESGSAEAILNDLSQDSTETDPRGFSLAGSLDLSTGYRFNHDPPDDHETDHRGWSELSADLDLEFKTRLAEGFDLLISGTAEYNIIYELKGREDYISGFLDENESDIDFHEVFIRGSLTKGLDVKIGRQIVVWGKSDNIRVTDILNPLDLRQPGMTDIEDLRLPVFMTRLDYYQSNIALSGYLVHERRFNRLPVYGSPYYYLPFQISDDKPSKSLDNTELAVSLAATFTGFDISLYAADIYDNTPYLGKDGRMHYPRIKMVGAAVNKASGNFLLKFEAACFDGIRLSAVQSYSGLQSNSKKYTRFDFLGGIEYNGFKNTSISYEIADRWLTDFDDAADLSGNNEHSLQHAFRFSRTFYNDVLEVSALVSLYGSTAEDGGFVRLQGEYDISDTVILTLGLVEYQSGPSVMLKDIGGNDLVFAKLGFSF